MFSFACTGQSAQPTQMPGQAAHPTQLDAAEETPLESPPSKLVWDKDHEAWCNIGIDHEVIRLFCGVRVWTPLMTRGDDRYAVLSLIRSAVYITGVRVHVCVCACACAFVPFKVAEDKVYVPAADDDEGISVTEDKDALAKSDDNTAITESYACLTYPRLR